MAWIWADSGRQWRTGKAGMLSHGVAKCRTRLSVWTTATGSYAIIHWPLGFPGSSPGKETTCNAGDLGSILGLGRPPLGGHGNLLQGSCLENPHGQRCLAGDSPWRHKESDWVTKHIRLWNHRDCQASCQLLRAEWERRPDIPRSRSMQFV